MFFFAKKNILFFRNFQNIEIFQILEINFQCFWVFFLKFSKFPLFVFFCWKFSIFWKFLKNKIFWRQPWSIPWARPLKDHCPGILDLGKYFKLFPQLCTLFAQFWAISGCLDYFDLISPIGPTQQSYRLAVAVKWKV